MTATPLIEIQNLRVVFHGDDGRTTHAVDAVDLAVAQGATLGLVGESGCGKSVTSLAVMGLLPKQSAEVTGSIQFDGFDLLNVSDKIRRDLFAERSHLIPVTSLQFGFRSAAPGCWRDYGKSPVRRGGCRRSLAPGSRAH